MLLFVFYGCILFHFYIKPQLEICCLTSAACCILFHFYIKPQPFHIVAVGRSVVSYSISTSNHNVFFSIPLNFSLYLIPFLHQTTTPFYTSDCVCVLYLIPFLHQTTTSMNTKSYRLSCILFHFYIKPQHNKDVYNRDKGCILFHFYIKPQPMAHKTLFSSTLSPKSHSHFSTECCSLMRKFKKTR